MAANLLKSGHFAQLLVWNRSADKCDALVAAGAVAVGSPAEAVARADIVFGMLSDPKAALEVSGASGMAQVWGDAFVALAHCNSHAQQCTCGLAAGRHSCRQATTASAQGCVFGLHMSASEVPPRRLDPTHRWRSARMAWCLRYSRAKRMLT
jgi:hypothetical protein